jgi:regulator of protease activity HflC (stomatin/prohibitin superfamily)
MSVKSAAKAKTSAQEEEAPLSLREHLSEWLTTAQFVLYTLLVLGLLGLGFWWQRVFIMVPPGHRGIMYRTLYGGTITDRSWGEGLHIIPPWDKMTIYDIRLLRKTLDLKVLTDEGLTLGVRVVVRYRPHENLLGQLQRDVGPEYFESLVQPEIEAHVRRTFGGRPAHEVYASMGDVLQELGQFPLIGKIEQTSNGPITHPYLEVQEIKLVEIDLPKIVEETIVEKYHQEQLMLAYKYKLEREAKEAERKRTEAAGIRDFNSIAGKVSADMLRWRSIDAALELAKSNNSKVIVLGGGQNNPALQLNLGDMQPQSGGYAPSESKPPAAEKTPPAPEKKAAPKKATEKNAPEKTPEEPKQNTDGNPAGAPPA